MEKQLFTWNGWDIMDTADFYFYGCELLVDIGEHKAGEKFKGIGVDYENGKLTLHLTDDVSEVYPLYLSVGNKVEK